MKITFTFLTPYSFHYAASAHLLCIDRISKIYFQITIPQPLTMTLVFNIIN